MEMGSVRQFDLSVDLIWILIIKAGFTIMSAPKAVPTTANIIPNGKKFMFSPFFYNRQFVSGISLKTRRPFDLSERLFTYRTISFSSWFFS